MAKKRKNNNKSKNNQRRKPSITEHVTESDDEEIDEDEAFNSEDERKYGSFFAKIDSKPKAKKKKDSDDDDSSDGESVTSGSDSSSDDDDDDESDDDNSDDGGQYMLDLLEKLDAPKNADATSGASASHMAQLPESEFSTVLTQTKDGSGGSKTLTLDNLMQGLEDTAGFSQLQKTFQNVSKGAATPAPLDRVVADRTQRKIVYKQESKDISGWMTAVQDNRQAETLDFKPNKDRVDIMTRDLLVEKFEPTTPFEKELEDALMKAGQADEQKMLEAEEAALQDDLGANKLTMEEYKKRRGQLAQMRALMSYYEQKRHHMKKIKSKKYRRIRKRQRERLKEGALDAAMEDDEDNDLAKDLQEKEEVARITERMSLAHKNTSKWARRILKRGNKVDMDTRRALSAQLQRGDDLRKKMMGGAENSDDDGSGGEEEDLVESARKVLSGIEEDDDPTNGTKSGLFKLAFMQRGVQKQRERAKDEARKLLKELEANERDDYDETAEDDDNGSDEDGNGTNKKKKKKKKAVASSEEMEKVLGKDGLVATSLEFGNSNSIATSGGIDIELPPTLAAMTTEKKNTPKPVDFNLQDKMGGGAEHTSTLSLSINGNEEKGQSSSKKDKKNKKKRKSQDTTKEAPKQDDEGESNPWMDVMNSWATETAAPTKKNKVSKTSKGVNKAGVVEVEGAADLLVTSSDPSKKTSTANKSSTSAMATETAVATTTTDKDKKIASMTQEELIRKAFVSVSDQDIDDDFRKEKEEMAAENDPSRKKAKQDNDPKDVMGWGSWAGAGAPPPAKKRRTLPKKLQAPVAKKEEVKRKDDKKPNVIINEKRIKKTANTFLLGEIPHPYTSRAEYEQAMMGGVGKEWNVTSAYKNMTRPEILTRSGKMILPISKRAKESRPAAKF